MIPKIGNIGTLIRNERISRGMTQEELGHKVGVGKAQISKIEKGRGLTIKTVTKVLDALNLSATVHFHPDLDTNRSVIGYIIANISEFANTYDLSIREASNYLNRFRGLDFLIEHYSAEHLLSIQDSVQDLTHICQNNGGGIK